MSVRASSPTSAPVPIMQQKSKPADTEIPIKEEESLTLPSPTTSTSVAQTEANSEVASSSPIRSTRRTEGQRRALLRSDPQAQEVEPHSVLCRNCQKWIRLSSFVNYAVANWSLHKQRCRGSPSTPRSVHPTPSKPILSPGSRVATAERKIVLLNDPQVKASSPGHVLCGTCKSIVALEGQVDYDLTKWIEHKEKCAPKTPAPITPEGSTSHERVIPPPSTSSTHSQVSVGRSARSPTPVGETPSNNSTETIAVTESSPAAVKVGVKRDREEETEDEEVAANVDERPTNRARTETYKPPEKGAPSLFGLFVHPLKEFARGFREGLSST